jgi:hypothetical protein
LHLILRRLHSLLSQDVNTDPASLTGTLLRWGFSLTMQSRCICFVSTSCVRVCRFPDHPRLCASRRGHWAETGTDCVIEASPLKGSCSRPCRPLSGSLVNAIGTPGVEIAEWYDSVGIGSAVVSGGKECADKKRNMGDTVGGGRGSGNAGARWSVALSKPQGRLAALRQLGHRLSRHWGLRREAGGRVLALSLGAPSRPASPLQSFARPLAGASWVLNDGR